MLEMLFFTANSEFYRTMVRYSVTAASIFMSTLNRFRFLFSEYLLAMNLFHISIIFPKLKLIEKHIKLNGWQ